MQSSLSLNLQTSTITDVMQSTGGEGKRGKGKEREGIEGTNRGDVIGSCWSVCIGDVEAVGRGSSTDDRSVSVRSGHTYRRRLQSENERVESHHPGHSTDRRRRLPVPD